MGQFDNKEQILNILTDGQGPKLKGKDMLGATEDENGALQFSGKLGSHKMTGTTTNPGSTVYLDFIVLDLLEESHKDKSLDEGARAGIWLLFESTTLHEITHEGDKFYEINNGIPLKEKGVPIEFPGEAGKKFEIDAYGEDIGPTNLGQVVLDRIINKLGGDNNNVSRGKLKALKNKATENER